MTATAADNKDGWHDCEWDNSGAPSRSSKISRSRTSRNVDSRSRVRVSVLRNLITPFFTHSLTGPNSTVTDNS